MCIGCWEDYGSPKDESDAVRAAAQSVGALYELEPAGGLLHIVVDDFNLEDEHLAWCRAKMESPEGAEFMRSNSSTLESWNALAALERLSEPQRWAAVALHAGYWETSPE